MAREIGLWIDHRKAVIVTVENDTDVTREIRSNIDHPGRFSSGDRQKGRVHERRVPAATLVGSPIANYLGRFLEGVVSFIREADSIWIIGPGEAKIELEKLIRTTDLGKRIVGVESVDKMTDVQIKTLVCEFFGR